MKKLKFLAFLMASLFAIVTFSCDNDDDEFMDTTISVAQLPQTSKTFVTQYFPGASITHSYRDIDDGVVEYDVTLNNGFEITFDTTGNWIDVDAPYGAAVPDGIIPATIAEYVRSTHKGQTIGEISKNSQIYDVELNNGIDLIFRLDGTFVRQET